MYHFSFSINTYHEFQVNIWYNKVNHIDLVPHYSKDCYEFLENNAQTTLHFALATV